MPDIAGPGSYLEKMLYAQRVVKAARYRTDQRVAVRELCEALVELVAALVEREQESNPKADQPTTTKERDGV